MSDLALKRRGRILKYIGNGKASVVLDDGPDPSSRQDEYTVDIPMAFATPDGSFIGGYPDPQTAVTIEQGQSAWYISGYIKQDRIWSGNSSGIAGIYSNIMADFKKNRVLIQSKKAANRIYLEAPEEDDPRGTNEIILGSALSSLQIDIKRDLISHDFANEYSFTYAHRQIIGTILRDIRENSLRNSEGSVLYDRNFNDNLWIVGMDPGISTTSASSVSTPRNLPLTEHRRVIYEFENISNEQNFEADNLEGSKLDPNFRRTRNKNVQRTENRAVAFNLNLYYPNNIFEEIIGTGVDTFGNIIDINRAILPIGQGDLSLIDNADTEDAFIRIRNAHRKALTYHFELNSRKENGATQKVIRGEDGLPDPEVSEDSLLGIYEPISPNEIDNYARDRSRFFIDIDKEGQFKINIPMSSEIGNVSLHTRYVNSSVLAFAEDKIETPNDFFLEDEGVDIYLENYTNNSSSEGIELNGLEGQVGPIDRFTGQPMKLNMVYHNILDIGSQFLKTRIEDDDLVRYQPDSSLNHRQDLIQLDKIITDKINVAGANANAGGRSGTINLDGMLSCSIGANTVDRQSMWLDTAGGIISALGRDRMGNSLVSTCDGNILVQIGGLNIDTDISKKIDTRFSKENDSAQNGVLDIRVIKSDGQLTVLRIDETGVSVATYGRFEVMAQQDIVFNSNSNILFDAPNIGFYYKNAPKFIERNQIRNI